MTQDEIIAMAKKAGCVSAEFWPSDFTGLMRVFERFASLVAARERERLAQEFERRAKPNAGWYEPEEPAEIIRAWDNVPPMDDEYFRSR